MTIIKNEKKILPIQDLKKYENIAYLEMGDDNGDLFFEILNKYSKIQKVSSYNLNEVIDALEEFDQIGRAHV